jgi:Flp pilus assembly protein TadB
VPQVRNASPAPNEPPTGAGSTFWNVILPILGFIGTGVGVLGFVIFFGGFIIWARFDATGLPADQAVAQVPRNDLVVTGASFLVPALLAALAAVAVALVLWDAVIGNRRRRRIGASEVRHKNAVASVEKLKDRAERLQKKIASTREKMGQLDADSKAAEPNSTEREAARESFDSEDAKYREQLSELGHLQETQLPEAKQEEAEAKRALDEAPKPDRSERLLQLAIGGVPMLLAEVLIMVAAWSALGWKEATLLIAVAAATLAVAIVVATLTQRFAWYALCVFVGVALLIAFATYERTRSTTKVSPVAAVDGAAPVTGFFVAETSDAVYVAQPHVQGDAVELDRETMTLVRISKKQLTGLTVGSLMSKPRAYRRSLELAVALCQREKSPIEDAEAGSKSSKAQRTARRKSSEDIKTLRNRLVWTRRRDSS